MDCKQAEAQKPSKKTVSGLPLQQFRYYDCQDTLPTHARFFEKYRLKYLKGLLKTLVYSEIKYHCRVIEDLSPLLSLLEEESQYVDIDNLVHFS